MKRLEKLIENTEKSRAIIEKLLEQISNEETRYDLIGLNNHLKLLQQILLEFQELLRAGGKGSAILEDPGYTTRVSAWSDGLLMRVKDYDKKVRKFSYELAHKYWLAVMDYVDTIIKNIDRWKKGLRLFEDLPSLPD